MTIAIIVYRKNRLNHRLLFGIPSLRVRRGWRRELVAFRPGQIFGYERWRADKFGTQDWRLFICRAVSDGSLSRIPGILPGAEILLSAIGKTQVKRALQAIDSVSNDCSVLHSVPLHRWRSVHNAVHSWTDKPKPREEERCG